MRHVASGFVAALLVGCLPSGGGGGGSGTQPGDTCSAAQHAEDVEVCAGSAVLECKEEDEGGAYYWELDKDCRDTDRTCRNGDCVESGGDGNLPGGGDDNPPPAGACPDLSGSWTFADHCEEDFIGDTYEVSQTGCNLSVSPVGWTGTVSAGGHVVMGGDAGGGTLTCQGDVSGSSLAVDCTPGGCHVVLER